MKRKKNLKTCMLIFLIIVFTGTILSSCVISGKDKLGGDKTQSNETTEVVDPYKEKIKLTAIHSHTAFGNIPFVEDDKVIEYIEKKFNIDFELTFVPSTAAGGVYEKLNMLISSGEIPDLMIANPTAIGLTSEIYRSLISAGKLIEMKKYISKGSQRYPNLAKNVYDEEADRYFAEKDGKIYCIPRFYGQWPHAYYIRADWLEVLGLKKPETLDELREVLRKFVKEDPDGKGNVGLTTGGIWWLLHIYAGFTGVQGYGILNGEIVSQWEMPAQKEAMKYVHTLYKENLLDKDILTGMGSGEDRSKFSSGRAGVLIVDSGFLNSIDKALSEYKPSAKADFLAADLRGPNFIARGGAGKFFEAISVSTGCKDPERALDLLEWLLTDEGKDIWNNGVEGVHYTIKDGKKVYNEALMKHEGWKNPDSPYCYHRIMTLITLDMPRDPSQFRDFSIYENFHKKLNEISNKVAVNYLLGKKVEAQIENSTKMSDVVNKWQIAFIVGEKSIDDDWETFLGEFKKAGYDKVKAEANEKYKP